MNEPTPGRRKFIVRLGAAALLSLAAASRVRSAPAARDSSPQQACCPVVELRQYTLRGGRRTDFARLFASTFVMPQETQGITVLGWFRDLDDPDRFVWMRGFPDMEARATALANFYGGDVWKAHRTEANSMIVDSDNVLLLRPLETAGGVDAATMRRSSTISAVIHYLPSKDAADFDRFFQEHLLKRIESDGGAVLGRLCTHEGPNNFPKLPVRSGESVYVWLTKFGSESQRAAFTHKWANETGWRDDVPDALLAAFMRKPEVLRLSAFPSATVNAPAG